MVQEVTENHIPDDLNSLKVIAFLKIVITQLALLICLSNHLGHKEPT